MENILTIMNIKVIVTLNENCIVNSTADIEKDGQRLQIYR